VTRINCMIESHAKESGLLEMTVGMGTTPELHNHSINAMAREDGDWTAEECEGS